MNAESITLTGRLTEQDALDLHRYRSFCYLRPSFLWLIGVVSFVLAALCVVIIVLGKGTVPLWAILITCIYVPFGAWYETRWRIRRQYRRHPEYYVETTVTVDEKNMSISNVNMDLRLAWKNVAFLLDTPKGLQFMLPGVRVLCFLPQRLFEGNDHENSIFEYAKQNNISIRLMK